MLESPLKIARSMKRSHQSGGFHIEMLYPGLILNEGDSGVGAIARIDDARLAPGTLVPMHHHKNDEILTYIRTAKLRHTDTVGQSEEASSQRLMLMGAGHTFRHQEEVPRDGETLRALQIFLRPREADLEPQVQFHDFGAAYSRDQWRLLTGPADAPLTLRVEAWVHDTRLVAGSSLALPRPPSSEVARLLYVFDGQVEVAGFRLDTGDSLLLNSSEQKVLAQEQSDLVLFTTLMSAPLFKGGMFSGNVLRP